MILADFLSLSIKLVIIAHVVVSLLLVLVVLMQRPKQEGLGAAFGAGMTDGMWGARTTDVLQRGTVYLGTLFFILALVLAILVGKDNAKKKDRATNDDADKQEEVVDAEKEKREAEEKAKEEMEKELKDAGGNVGGTPDGDAGEGTGEGTGETPASSAAPETPAQPETPAPSTPPAETSAPEGETEPNNG